MSKSFYRTRCSPTCLTQLTASRRAACSTGAALRRCSSASQTACAAPGRRAGTGTRLQRRLPASRPPRRPFQPSRRCRCRLYRVNSPSAQSPARVHGVAAGQPAFEHRVDVRSRPPGGRTPSRGRRPTAPPRRLARPSEWVTIGAGRRRPAVGSGRRTPGSGPASATGRARRGASPTLRRVAAAAWPVVGHQVVKIVGLNTVGRAPSSESSPQRRDVHPDAREGEFEGAIEPIVPTRSTRYQPPLHRPLPPQAGEIWARLARRRRAARSRGDPVLRGHEVADVRIIRKLPADGGDEQLHRGRVFQPGHPEACSPTSRRTGGRSRTRAHQRDVRHVGQLAEQLLGALGSCSQQLSHVQCYHGRGRGERGETGDRGSGPTGTPSPTRISSRHRPSALVAPWPRTSSRRAPYRATGVVQRRPHDRGLSMPGGPSTQTGRGSAATICARTRRGPGRRRGGGQPPGPARGRRVDGRGVAGNSIVVAAATASRARSKLPASRGRSRWTRPSTTHDPGRRPVGQRRTMCTGQPVRDTNVSQPVQPATARRNGDLDATIAASAWVAAAR